MDMHSLPGEAILRLVAEKYEITLAELYASMPRPLGTRYDFYPLALLNHAGYIEFDLSTETQGVTLRGCVGLNPNAGAERFEAWCLDDDAQWRTICKAYLTAKGMLKLEELALREEARRVKRRDYGVTAAIAISVALLTGALRLAVSMG